MWAKIISVGLICSFYLCDEFITGQSLCNNLPCFYGTCTNNVCVCILGYAGTTCDSEIDNCQTNPCLNNGACADLLNNSTCLCQCGYTGMYCATYNPCTIFNPCKNGGTCYTSTTNKAACTCTAAFTGDNCTTAATTTVPTTTKAAIQICTNNYCGAHGTCSNGAAGPVCSCSVGYVGATCAIIDNMCASNPCLNGGTCGEQNVNFYSCSCAKGWNGTNCEVLDTIGKLTEGNNTAHSIHPMHPMRVETGFFLLVQFLSLFGVL